MIIQIYDDYNDQSKELIEEWITSCTVEFFENGYATTKNHRNQICSPFWSFYVHRYQSETDIYKCIAWIHAEGRTIVGDESYCHEIDTNNSGSVYYISDIQLTEMER